MDVKMKILLLFCLLTSPSWARWSASTYNIRNFDKDYQSGSTNLSELTKIIKSHKSDVMTFVEVVNAKAFETLMQSTLPGYKIALSNCGGFGKQRLAVVWNPAVFTYVGHSEDFSFSGESNACGSLRPALLVNLIQKSTGKDFLFTAIHLKAGGAETAMRQRWLQYQLLEKLAKKYQDKQLIMMGDFNTTGYNIQNEDFVKFENLMKNSGLYTTSENLGCTSYWNGGDGDLDHESSILDHVIVEKELANTIQSVTVGAHCALLECRDATPEELGASYLSVSDHCPIQVNFK